MLHCKVASLSWSQPSDQNLYEATQKNENFSLPPASASFDLLWLRVEWMHIQALGTAQAGR